MGTARNPDRPTLGPQVVRLSQLLGVPAMPWQEHVLDVALERDGDRWAYPIVVCEVPRRAGKTTMTFVRQAHRAVARPFSNIVWGAQNRTEGLKIWDQQSQLLLPYKDKLRFKARRSQGSESMRYVNGSRVSLFTPDGEGGVGTATDDVTLDEARFHSPSLGAELEAAIMPTQDTTDGQLWLISSAGSFGVGDWFYGWLQKAEAQLEQGRGIALFRYGIPDDGDPLDLDLVCSHHPAVGHTIDRMTIAERQERMEPYDFAREYGSQWTRNVEQVIPGHDWVAGADTRRPMPDVGQLTLGFATSPTRSTSSIGAAWRTPDGRLYVAVLDHRPGVDWLIPRVHELREKWKPKGIVFNAVGPAVTIADKLKRDRVKLRGASTPEFVVACGQFYEHVLAREIFHHAQPALDDAVAGVGKRTLGERWVWGYKASEASISPLEAVTLAAWGFDHRPARRTPVVVGG